MGPYKTQVVPGKWFRQAWELVTDADVDSRVALESRSAWGAIPQRSLDTVVLPTAPLWRLSEVLVVHYVGNDELPALCRKWKVPGTWRSAWRRCSRKTAASR